MRYRYIFFPWYNQQVFAIELSFLAFRIYGPVRRLLNADFVWVLKTEPTCSRLRCRRGAGRLAATTATSATLAGVPFHPRDARGQEALTKNVASSPPVIRPPVRVTRTRQSVILQGYAFPVPHRALSLAIYRLGTNKQPL